MFTHLHVHTEFSLLDGAARIPALLNRTQELGMESIAVTDHGSMHAVVDFYLAARAAGIKPILGCEVYVAPTGRANKGVEDKTPYHLVLLARNNTGYRHLLQLVSKAHLEGFYYKPRVDKELLTLHNEGLIALSACTNGEIARLIQEGRRQEAAKAALWYRQCFDHFYLEVQNHPIPQLEPIYREIVSLAKETEIPLVATNDVHYVQPSDAYAHDILLCIQTGASVRDERRMRMKSETFYLRSPEEMASLFDSLPEAIRNTQRIADMCDLSLEFDRLHLPETDIPAGFTPDEYLAHLCWKGLKDRYGEASEEMAGRLRYEMEVIRETQFARYFLVVWDFVTFARRNQIMFGVRGSAAGSIVLYCLGITDIDPLAHGLLFERFLNVERKELPDIDMDFVDDRRDEVIQYVGQKYGHDHVAQIITFGTLGAKAAIRDVGRALGMPYAEVDRVAKLVPPALNITIDSALRDNPELHDLYLQDEQIRQLVDTARQLEGIARHASTHAAGLVISKDPLTDHVPLQRPIKSDGQGMMMTQFDMNALARIGLLKMDLLGLVYLTILSKAREFIARTSGIDIDLQRIPLDDPQAFDLLSAGETTGIFQLESAGMRKYIKELKPTCLGDVAAMIALYRPGPMAHIPEFIAAKRGDTPIRYIHPSLEPILRESYGVITYQDQVLLIVQAIAGYTLGQADVFRKAMGKKIAEKMKEQRETFVVRAQERGISQGVATQIFDLIEPFAGYAFNKAHSACYATLAYQTAYLKAHYPVEYMAAVMTAYTGSPEKVASSVAECQRMGVTVLPPDVNKSNASFTIETIEGNDGNLSGAIRFGLAAIKNVGETAIEGLISARREGGEFASVEDLCKRVDLGAINRRMVESLIKAGAMDCLGKRASLLGSVDRMLALAQQHRRLKDSGQTTMFDLWGASVPVPTPDLVLDETDIPPKELLSWEKELLGVYFSEHPFTRAARRLAQATTAFCGEIAPEMIGQRVVVAGIVLSTRQLFTKDKKPFVAAVLEDLHGSVEVTAFPRLYSKTRELWKDSNILLIEGQVKVRGDQAQLVCDSVRAYEEEASPEATEDYRIPDQPSGPNLEEDFAVQSADSLTSPGRQILITLRKSADEENDIDRLREVFSVLKEFPGKDLVRLAVATDEDTTELDLPDLTTGYCDSLHQRLITLLGEEGVAVR